MHLDGPGSAGGLHLPAQWLGDFDPSISVPVSLIGTFSAMYLLGYTLDNLSLMALTIATGFVVDDAIVVIENITRHIEQGVQPMEAALKGAQEIGFTVLSMSISLIAVFIPILMMGGIVGRLFREFAVVLSRGDFHVDDGVADGNADDVLAAAQSRAQSRAWMYRTMEREDFQWIISTYGAALRVVLNHPGVTMLVMLVTIGVNVYLYIKIPKGFFPQQDTGRMQGQVQGQQHISFAALSEKLSSSKSRCVRIPAVRTVDSVCRLRADGGGNSGQMIFS